MALICTSCGASFFGDPLAASWKCRHCGREHVVEAVRDAMVQEKLKQLDPEEPPPPLPAQPVVTELPCLKCGYSLRGLTSEMSCPECGWSVADSMKGDLLQFAGDDELARLHRGAVLVECTLICSVLLGLVGGIGGAIVGVAGGQGVLPQWLPEALRLTSVFVGLGLTVASVVGWWWLSEPDPARRDGPTAIDQGRRWRHVLRAALVVSLGLSTVSSMMQLFPQFANVLTPQQPVQPATPGGGGVMAFPIFPPITPWLISHLVLTGIAFVAQLVGAAASMLYLRTLAPRVPSAQMERFCTMMAWLSPLLSTVGLLLCGLGPIAALIMTIVAIEMLRGPIRIIRTQRRALAGGS